MKKIYSFFIAFFAIITISAQLQTQLVSNGVYKLTYGASNDYTLYNPNFASTFWVHCWINSNQNSQNVLFNDSWNNSNVTMNWDSVANAYIGYIDLNTKVFTNTNNTVSVGTTVNGVNFVFKNQQNGATNQSGNLSAPQSTTLSTLATIDINKSIFKSFVSEGKLYTSKKGNLNIQVLDFSGKVVKSINTKSSNAGLELNLPKKGNYILKVNDEIIKISY